MSIRQNEYENRISIGRGTKDTLYHFDFLDIDIKPKNEIDSEGSHDEQNKVIPELPNDFLDKIPRDLLVYRTQHGYHLVYPSHIVDRYYWSSYLRQFTDPKCPHNAIRVIPFNDYKLIQVPRNIKWCPRVFGKYLEIFGSALTEKSYYSLSYFGFLLEFCNYPLKPGFYHVSRNGQKLLGKDRVPK